MATTYTYPFDPTGSATTNAVANERHVLSPPAWTDFYFIVPKFAPYFRDSLRVIHRPSGKLLVEGKDYHCTHYFHAASHGVARRVYGSITMLDKTLTGILEISYQTIGGDWVLDASSDLTRLTNTQTNPRITTWEEVVDVPYQFPPIDHQWDLEDLKGVEAILPILEEMTVAIRESAGSDFSKHINDKNNPHSVTKAQVGLDLVENFPLANLLEAQAGAANNRYMTPMSTRSLIDTYMVPQLTAHKLDVGNPHQTTKAQVGLGSVQNYPIASAIEARAGTATDRYMTPLTVKQAIDANLTGSIDGHVNNTNNPHATTKAQVGLGSVENFPIASTDDAEGASRNDRYMTPLTTAKEIQVLVGETLQFHIGDKTNPHGVTADQIGTYTKQQIDQSLTAKLDRLATAADSGKLGGFTYTQLVNTILGSTVANSNAVNGYSAQDIINTIQAGTVKNATQFDGKTFDEVHASIVGDMVSARQMHVAGEELTYVGTVENWVQIFSSNPELGGDFEDAVVLVTGGVPGALNATTSLLRISHVNNSVNGVLLEGAVTNAQFRYLSSAGSTRVWMRTTTDLTSPVITILSGDDFINYNKDAPLLASAPSPSNLLTLLSYADDTTAAKMFRFPQTPNNSNVKYTKLVEFERVANAQGHHSFMISGGNPIGQLDAVNVVAVSPDGQSVTSVSGSLETNQFVSVVRTDLSNGRIYHSVWLKSTVGHSEVVVHVLTDKANVISGPQVAGTTTAPVGETQTVLTPLVYANSADLSTASDQIGQFILDFETAAKPADVTFTLGTWPIPA